MDLTGDTRIAIELIVEDTLNTFKSIADLANDKIKKSQIITNGDFANSSTSNDAIPAQHLRRIFMQNRESYQTLESEPAIARILTTDNSNKETVYYICRTTAISGLKDITLASYRAPVGRLAALPIGEQLTLANGITLTVLERVALRPVLDSDGWDSQDSAFNMRNLPPFTIESLRSFLKRVLPTASTGNILDELLAEETAEPNIIDGLRRKVIEKMGLRDQPILDEFQDEIFRLPINKRIIILGPPGTGKTTTLIRRLGQKLDIDSLDDSDTKLIANLEDRSTFKDSWLMFTPTKLLKLYLKEAFNRERVPASDLRITTWNDYRWDLARLHLGLLQRSDGKGPFVLMEDLPSLHPIVHSKSLHWYRAFAKWQVSSFVQHLLDKADLLMTCESGAASALGRRLNENLSKSEELPLLSIFQRSVIEIPKAKEIISEITQRTTNIIEETLSRHLADNRNLLDELAHFLTQIQRTPNSNEDKLENIDNEIDDKLPTTDRAGALNAYKQAIRSQARAHVTNRSVGKNSRSGKVLGWLGDRIPSASDISQIGNDLIALDAARNFTNPVKSYFDGISKRYIEFRQSRSNDSEWYTKEKYGPKEVHPLELDIVLLTTLRSAWRLLSNPNIRNNIDSVEWSCLKPILGCYRNQIVVDEATDFSPVQLACIASLAEPMLNSFFACGDFNQRLTTWGTRSEDELKWILSDIEVKQVDVSYRQSRQLSELGIEIIKVFDGYHQSVRLPEHIDNEGVEPVLIENANTVQFITGWLAERIQEIERFVNRMPSTAVFVNSESDVEPVSNALKNSLSSQNIQVQACPQGLYVGQNTEVCVFDIQHIKGLEFEAVFFIGLDKLAHEQPELFEKYLYVGATRAATYLGVTCEEKFPTRIDSLRSHFGSDWDKKDIHS